MPEDTELQGTRLRRIEIENFRGITELALSFVGLDDRPASVAVIGGPNGCGKTAVLEACLLAAGHPELVRGAHGRHAVRSGAGDYRIRAEFQTGEDRQVVERTASSGNSKFTVDCAYFSSWRAPRLVGAVSVTAGKRGNRPQPTEENRLWIIKQYLVNAKAHVSMSTPPTPRGSSDYEAVLDRVNEIWKAFHPQGGESFSVEPFGDDPDEGFDVFLNRADGIRVPLDALSSGQLELFMLAGSALPKHGAEPILCIDEPELHLDPQWHRLILRTIRRLRPASQVIVGTHSPEIYDSVMSFERHFLVPQDDPRARAWDAVTDEKVAGVSA